MPWSQQQKPPHYLLVFPNKYLSLWKELNKRCVKEQTTKADFIRRCIKEKLEKDASGK
tara:strand:- start:1182 stop:1355 length:174 start_codon:yes stop_codon:yes gene_type:complete